MASKDDDIFVITILIQMHGKVINFALHSRDSEIFDNVRLLCKAGDFDDFHMTPAFESQLFRGVQPHFTRDLQRSTYDILNAATSGVLVDRVTYDKALSIIESDEVSSLDRMINIQGIYLVSIHKKGKLVYPTEGEKTINLLQLRDLNLLAKFFGTKVPDIRPLSTVIPSQSIYIEEEQKINADSSLSQTDKDKKKRHIRNQFYNHLKHWLLTIEGHKITSIKLSALVELVKVIVGQPCFINLLDYSCNSPTIYIPQEQAGLQARTYLASDIEMGIEKKMHLGGKKRRNSKKRKTKRKMRRNKSKKRI